MARRRRWVRARQRRLLAQATVLVVVVAFLSLGSPTNRATANTILVWLAIRFGIGASVLLALWWAWEFARPPKVKRRKHKRIPRAKHVRSHKPTDGRVIDDTPPYGFPAVEDEIPSTREALLGAKMSGARPLYPTEDDDG
jgi:hypothetical protein